MKRNLALLLMVALLATACGGEAGTTPTTTTSGNETTSEPVEDSLFESDDLPADLKFGGKTLKINVQETRLKQYYIEEETGDIVDDSIYTARRNVEDRLDVVLEYPTGAYLTWADRSTYIDQIMSSVMAGADDFDVLCSSTFIAEFMARGILTDISETPYLNFDKPWWSKGMIDAVTFNGVIPFVTGDISIGLIKSMMCMYFNKDLAADFKVEDLYDKVFAGDWTLDTFESTIKDVYNDVNGNTQKDNEDTFGFVLEGSNYASGFYSSCDMSALAPVDGKISFVYDSAHCVDVVQRLVSILHNLDSVYIHSGDEQTYLAEEALFNNGNVLITGGWIGCSESYRDLDFDYGIIPYPKCDENQNDYKTTLLGIYSKFAIPVTCDDTELAGAVLEALGSEFYRTVTPTYFETALKVKYARDDETAQMFDLIRGSVSPDLGVCFTYPTDNLADIQFKNAVNNGGENWASRMESIKSTSEEKINTINEAYMEMAK